MFEHFCYHLLKVLCTSGEKKSRSHLQLTVLLFTYIREKHKPELENIVSLFFLVEGCPGNQHQLLQVSTRSILFLFAESPPCSRASEQKQHVFKPRIPAVLLRIKFS